MGHYRTLTGNATIRTLSTCVANQHRFMVRRAWMAKKLFFFFWKTLYAHVTMDHEVWPRTTGDSRNSYSHPTGFVKIIAKRRYVFGRLMRQIFTGSFNVRTVSNVYNDIRYAKVCMRPVRAPITLFMVTVHAFRSGLLFPAVELRFIYFVRVLRLVQINLRVCILWI